eukprot:jgi/Picsp_1/5509/NSC_02868-R1_---NA---
MLRRALHSIARIQREGRFASQLPIFEELYRGTQASVWYECESERQAGSSHLMKQPRLLSNKGFMRPSFSQDKEQSIQGNTSRKNDSSLIGEEKQGDSHLEGLGTLCGLASHVSSDNSQSPFLSDEIRADSVRRKRKKKMNKHKHAKRRKLNRHRR